MFRLILFSDFKRLVLITFFIQKCLYLFSFHPLNFGSLKMTEILQTTQLERNLFKIEDKIARYSHHRIFLEKYKNNRKYPKGLPLSLTFRYVQIQKIYWSHAEKFYAILPLNCVIISYSRQQKNWGSQNSQKRILLCFNR